MQSFSWCYRVGDHPMRWQFCIASFLLRQAPVESKSLSWVSSEKRRPRRGQRRCISSCLGFAMVDFLIFRFVLDGVSFCIIGFITIWGICWHLFLNHLVLRVLYSKLLWATSFETSLAFWMTKYLVTWYRMCLNLFFKCSTVLVLLDSSTFKGTVYFWNCNLANLTMKHV